jgi:general secretion pathway protein J
MTQWGGAPIPLFEGSPSMVTFARSAIGPNSYPHLELVRFASIKEDRGIALVRTRAPSTPTAAGASVETFSFGDAVALIRAPFHISFAYAGPDRVWVDSWKGQERLPDAVRITVRDAVGGARLTASTAVRIRVTGRSIPKLEANADTDEARRGAAVK